MHKAIEILMEEHRLIEKVMASLLKCSEKARAGEAPERSKVSEYAEFLREFADKCHHGKEEERLFSEMTRNGFPREQGPIAVMLHEHEEGRKCVRRLSEIGAGRGGLVEAEKRDFVENAEGFCYLLTEHINKEDNILYPLSENVIPKGQWEGLLESFESFERDEIGEGRHKELVELGRRLSTG